MGNGVKLPCVVTLHLRLPGMEADAKLELFDFEFTQFTDGLGPGIRYPMANMPNMRC